MSQLAFDIPKNKNGNDNGHHSRPRECDLAADLRHWLDDLDAAESLKREELGKIRKLRSDIYTLAKARGVSATMLRATRALLRK